MVRRIMRLAEIALTLSLSVALLYAGDAKSAKTPAAPKSGFRAETLGQLGFVEKRIEDLAEAVPAEKYAWRPGEGVRSVGEVYVHFANSSYLFMGFLKVKGAKPYDPALEKSVSNKAEIAKLLKASFEDFKTAILNLTDKDLDKQTVMFGSPSTYRNVIVTTIAHMHEHLGQSIAYARVNGVVPPWTAAEEAAAAQKSAK